jgi:hypothetical protein
LQVVLDKDERGGLLRLKCCVNGARSIASRTTPWMNFLSFGKPRSAILRGVRLSKHSENLPTFEFCGSAAR